MNTLYVSDLDGTLLYPNAELSHKTITTLNKLLDQGLLFTVATARSIASAKNILKDLKISLPIVLMNGVCIYDLAIDDYINIEYLPKKSIPLLLNILKQNNMTGFAYSIKDSVMSTYYENLSTQAMKDFYQERVNLYQKPFIQINDFEAIATEPLIYFTFLDQREKLEPLFHLIDNLPGLNCVFYKDNYSPDLWYLETYSMTASKYDALLYLRNYLKPDKIVSFGDNRNDLPLFEASDVKIAVGNAVKELKDKADFIIGRNVEDGVATWLEHHV